MNVCTRLVCIAVTVATQRVPTNVVVFQNGVELTARQVLCQEGFFYKPAYKYYLHEVFHLGNHFFFRKFSFNMTINHSYFR